MAGAQYSKRIPPKMRLDYFRQGNTLLASSISQVCQHLEIEELIFVSTDMVYGSQKTTFINEKTTPRPIGPYGNSKLDSEEIFRSMKTNTRTTVLRPRLIIGEGRKGTIEQLAKWISTGMPIPIIGDGSNRYQFIGVDDLVRGILAVQNSKLYGTFNIGSDNPPRVSELLPYVLKKLGRKNRLMHLPAMQTKMLLRTLDSAGISPLVPEQFEIADLDYVLDTNKLKTESGWMPIQSDEEMLYSALSSILG